MCDCEPSAASSYFYFKQIDGFSRKFARSLRGQLRVIILLPTVCTDNRSWPNLRDGSKVSDIYFKIVISRYHKSANSTGFMLMLTVESQHTRRVKNCLVIGYVTISKKPLEGKIRNLVSVLMFSALGCRSRITNMATLRKSILCMENLTHPKSVLYWVPQKLNEAIIIIIIIYEQEFIQYEVGLWFLPLLSPCQLLLPS